MNRINLNENEDIPKSIKSNNEQYSETDESRRVKCHKKRKYHRDKYSEDNDDSKYDKHKKKSKKKNKKKEKRTKSTENSLLTRNYSSHNGSNTPKESSLRGNQTKLLFNIT